VIVVAIGALLVSLLVKRDPENPGVLVKKWQDILVVIGSDISD